MKKMIGKRGGVTAGSFSGEKVPKTTAWTYSMSGIFRDACYVLVSGSYLSYIKTAGLLSSNPATYKAQLSTIIGLYIVLLIWDGLNDPLMGIIIEKCHFKYGKFRPWILIGAIGNIFAVLLMFLAQPSGWWCVACFGIYYFLWDFVFTMNDIAYWSMLPSLSGDEKERSKLTTLVSIASGIGQAAMYGLTGLLVNVDNIGYIYKWLAVPTAILFLISQAAVFFFCKEHARDPKQEEVSRQTKFKDLFLMVKKNQPLRMSVLAIFFYYLVGAVTSTFGYDYFVFTYGYGGSLAGYVYVVNGAFSVIAGLGGQIFFGLISRKMKLLDIVRLMFYLTIGFYLVAFILATPMFGNEPLAYSPVSLGSDGTYSVNILGGTGWLLFIPLFFSSASTSIFYLALLVLMQNSIEYNEWKFGERKESVAFAWRPLDAKISSAAKWALYMIALVATGTISVYNTINSTSESLDAGDAGMTSAAANKAVQDSINALSQGQKIGFCFWYFGLAIGCMIVAYLFIRLGYHLTDEEHHRIVVELDKKHQAENQKTADTSSVTSSIS